MKTMKLTIRGTRPLLLHSDVGCDPLSESAVELARMTKRKDKKTADAQHEIARVEWEAGLYYDDDGGVHIPTWNVIRSIQDGARMSKSGKLIERAVTALDERAYFGLPKDLDALWSDPQYRDRRSVKVGQARVIRTRPRIPTGWKLTIGLAYVETMIDEDAIREFASMSGALIGLGDFRQRFGRYEVVG
jgi:hypothetical protein